MGIIIYIIVLLVYLVVPAPVQFVILIGNLLVPDSVILVDELVMIFGFLKKLSTASSVLEWISEHKALCVIIAIIAVVLIISVVGSG